MALRSRRDVVGRGAVRGASDGPVPHQEVGRRLRLLLAEADRQDAVAGRVAWLANAVDLLVPDEARILGVLATGGAAGCPLLHIHCVTPTGLAGEVLLENVTGIGPDAGLALPQLVPYYVGRLVSLDLVEVGAEDERLHDDYPALLAAPAVLAALAAARQQGLTPRVMRHSLRLSPLGRELWGTQFTEEQDGSAGSRG